MLIRSAVLPLLEDNIDTDQIYPARFLTVTGKADLGQYLFADRRPEPGFPLDEDVEPRPQILLTGENFGSGSSREHAVWALKSWGIRALIAPSFGEIFRVNALNNGLVPVEVSPETFLELRLRSETGALEAAIDLERQLLSVEGMQEIPFPIDSFSKTCILRGVDPLGYILSFEDRIKAFEAETDPAVH